MCRWVVYVPITTMSVIAAMEAFIRMRCVANINIIVAEVKKSIAVVKSAGISDHWKEKALRQYAWNIMRQTALIAFKFLLLIGVFTLVFFVAGSIIAWSCFDFFTSIASMEVQLIALLASIVYIVIRRIFSYG